MGEGRLKEGEYVNLHLHLNTNPSHTLVTSSVRVLNRRGIAFVRYKLRACAEFAKARAHISFCNCTFLLMLIWVLVFSFWAICSCVPGLNILI